MMPEPQLPTPEQAPATAPKQSMWLRRVLSVAWVIFCFELGLVLMIYPWTEAWTSNYFAWLGSAVFQHRWHEIWMTGYVRGAVTGLGVANVWAAIAEALRMYIGTPEKG